MQFTSDEQIVSFATKTKPPDWQTKLFTNYRQEVQIHYKGKLFYKLDRLFPNEDDMSKGNRIISFEPVTRGSFRKGISNIMRIFINSSFTAQASDKTLKEITQPVYDDKNLFSYFLDKWVNIALGNDPNSLIVIYPKDYAEKNGIEQIGFVASENIIYFDNETFIFRCLEESEVKHEIKQTYLCQIKKFYDKSIHSYNFIDQEQYRQVVDNSYTQEIETKFTRTIYHVFSQNKFYRLEQDKTDTSIYQIDEYTLENFTDPPVRFVGGLKGEMGLYESFLSAFVPFGNLALIQHSQHTAVNSIFSFPRLSEVQTPCDNPACKGGKIACDDCPEGEDTCPYCNGTGFRAIQSPYKTYVQQYDPSGLQDNAVATMDMVRYYTPPEGVLTYSKNEWKGYLEMAEMAIYVQQKVQTGNVQSAESKTIDLDELYSFLLLVSKTFYNNLRFVIQCEENYLNSSPIDVSVEIPFSFAIISESDAFEALNTILSSAAPDIIKGNQVENFILKFISQTSPVRLAYEVLRLVDVLLLKTDNEINLLKSNNIVTSDQWATHTFAYPVLLQMYMVDRSLFDDNNIQAVADQLKEKLKAFTVQPTGLTQNLMTKFTQPLPQPNVA
jgi:hypothetical protein